MNDTLIDAECPCIYLGHMIRNKLKDNEDIEADVIFLCQSYNVSCKDSVVPI